MSREFEFWAPMTFFEKANAPDGQKRRVAGICSSVARDKEDERVFQRGLDFSDVLTDGYFNDNHDKATDSPVGVPTEVGYFRKGQALPDGSVAKRNCHWSEGYLLNTKRADRVWELGKALEEAGGDRALGFSIEGKIQRRSPHDRRDILKAKVRNIAITNCPVNHETRMQVFMKSLRAACEEDEANVEKALTMGPPTAPAGVPVGPRQGEGAGEIITRQSLEGGPDDEEERKKKLRAGLRRARRLTKGEAVSWLQGRLPQASTATIGRIVDLTIARQKRGIT